MRRAGPPSLDDGGNASRRDSGFTFVETVLTVVLMGMVIVPVLAAVQGVVRASTTSEASAQVETVLINAVDRVHALAIDQQCDLADVVSLAAPTDWPAGSVTATQQSLGGDNGDEWVDACDTQAAARRITITVTSPGNEIRRSIQIVTTELETPTP